MDVMPLWLHAVMDEALDALDDDIGFRIGGGILNSMGFADDLNLIASTVAGLQKNLDTVAGELLPKGLAFNDRKCHTLSMVPSGKDKKVKIVDDGVPFMIQGLPIKKLSIGTPWTYLGIQFSTIGICHKDVSIKLTEGLQRLRSAPLKPQQRIFLLKCFLIPQFYHSLVLGKIRVSSLNQLDIQLRQALRSWLRLPHDVPVAYFHSCVKDGGLGIPSFRWDIPRMKLGRLSNIRKSTDPIIRNLANTRTFQARERDVRGWCGDGEGQYETREAVQKLWSCKLFNSIDGKGLREASKVPAAHSWISDGNMLLSGHEYLDMICLRINALPTKARTSRGRHVAANCRAGCSLPSTLPARETLPHVLQCCFRTHGARIKRHDAVSRMIGDRLEKKRWEVLHEPRFVTEEGLRKPDLVATLGDTTWVIDPQVVLDSAPLKPKHQQKTQYYGRNEDLVRLIKLKTKARNVKFTSATLNWRGIWEETCAQELVDLGLTKQDLKFISIRVLQGGLQGWSVFNTMTGVTRPDARTGVG